MEEHIIPYQHAVGHSGCVPHSHDDEHHVLHPSTGHCSPADPRWLHLLCQPVDVGVNKPIKKAVRIKWKDWMTETGRVNTGVAKDSMTRMQPAKWIVGYESISKETGCNAWKRRFLSGWWVETTVAVISHCALLFLLSRRWFFHNFDIKDVQSISKICKQICKHTHQRVRNVL